MSKRRSEAQQSETQQGGFIKIRMNVSIAGKLPCGTEFGYQPEQVVLVDAALAETWISVGHAERVARDEPLTELAALGNNDFLEHDPRLVHRLQGYVSV